MEKISKNNSYNTCTCKNNFNGSHCSVPASIWKIHESNSQKKGSGLTICMKKIVQFISFFRQVLGPT